MYKGKKVGVIIAAGGTGRRMGAEVPKQFIQVQGETMLIKTIGIFALCKGIDRIYVVAPRDYMEMTRSCIEGELPPEARKKIGGIISGGEDRQRSVHRALTAISRQRLVPEIMLIHDGARPYVSLELISDVIKTAVESGNAVPCIKLKDTVRSNEGTLDREKLLAVQTPQGFATADLINAYGRAQMEGFTGTDDASLVERLGIGINCIPGERSNIKVTTPDDIREERRIGNGFDVHRFGDKLSGGKKTVLILGGAIIPHDRELIAHSDGDVLIHAVMDSLLGAAGMGDIGEHFPDNDPEYENASSMMLLRNVKEMLDEKHFKIENIDAAIICQKPRIAPYRQEMRENIAKALRMDGSVINVKATTTEGLGFTGRGEGIAAQAVSILKR